MVRKPEVIISDLRHERASCLAQGDVAMGLCMPLTLLEWKGPYLPLSSCEILRASDLSGRRAVTNYEQFEIGVCLCENGLHSEGQKLWRSVDRQRHREAGMGHN